MPSLQLTIDASRMRAGATEAKTALETVKVAATGAAGAIGGGPGAPAGSPGLAPAFDNATKGFRGFRDALQSAGGIQQIGANVANLRREVDGLGSGLGAVSNAGFLLSNSLLGVARLTEDVRQLRAAQDAAGKSASTLSLIWKAHPVLLIATAVSAAAGAMALFASNTDKATGASDRLAESQKSLRQAMAAQSGAIADRGFLQRIGASEPDPGTTLREQLQYLQQQVRRIREAGAPIGAYDLADIVRGSGAGGVQLEELQRSLGRPGGAAGREKPFAAFEAETVLANRARLLQRQLSQYEESERLGAFQRGAPQPTVGVSSEQYGPSQREAEIQLLQQEIQLQEQLNQARQLGEEFGASVGNALMSIATGANTARQALAQLLQTFVQMATSRAVQGFAGALGQAFGGTVTQGTPNVPGGGGGGTGATPGGN